MIKINLIESEIISISFSPDGTIISLALSNGSVYFYQVCDFIILINNCFKLNNFIIFQVSFENNIIGESPKCVFSWHPKEVFLSLRSMAFLDNRKHINGEYVFL